jgi:hypothetical protein
LKGKIKMNNKGCFYIGQVIIFFFPLVFFFSQNSDHLSSVLVNFEYYACFVPSCLKLAS